MHFDQIVDRLQVRPMELGVAMLATARSVAAGRVQFTNESFDRLAGTDQVRKALDAGASAADIANSWQADLQHFVSLRERYLLY